MVNKNLLAYSTNENETLVGPTIEQKCPVLLTVINSVINLGISKKARNP